MIIITGPHDPDSKPIKPPTLAHKGKAKWKATNMASQLWTSGSGLNETIVWFYITWEWEDKRKA